jgi:hypothetical protein
MITSSVYRQNSRYFEALSSRGRTFPQISSHIPHTPGLIVPFDPQQVPSFV